MRTLPIVAASLGLVLAAACGDEAPEPSGIFDDLPMGSETLDCKAPADDLRAPDVCGDFVTAAGEVCSYCLHRAEADGALHVVYEDESSCGPVAGCGGPATPVLSGR